MGPRRIPFATRNSFSMVKMVVPSDIENDNDYDEEENQERRKEKV